MKGFSKITRLDFLTMKSHLAGYLSLVLVVLMGASAVVLCYAAAWLAAFMSSSIFSIQEKNNLDRLYGSVSVNVKDIVLGRYVFVFLSYITSVLVVIALYSYITLFQNKALGLNELILGFSLSLFVFSIITGIQMPLYFKLGYTKAKVCAMIPFAIVMVLPVITSYISDLSGIIKFMQSNQSALIVVSILASCIIEFLSYKTAVVFYYHKRIR